MFVSRRAFVAGVPCASLLAAFGFHSSNALARGRLPAGGSLSLRVPWPLATIDPHRADEAAPAFFSGALFDTLFTVGEGGAFVPSLADGDAELVQGTVRIKLRPGVKSAGGKPIEAPDVLFSLTRARARSAKAWLANVPLPKVEDKSTLRFATKELDDLVRVLASPLTAIVPSSFSPNVPDGTGPFRFERRGDAIVFRKNPNAVEGPGFLDEIVVRTAADVGASLRAFESGTDDIGWLGSGLHDARAGARHWDAGAVGWAVLATGREAGEWDAPGTAQRLADGIPHARLSYLMIGAPWPATAGGSWGGAACDVIVRDDSPWLIELARAAAATLSQPGHEVSVRPVGVGEFTQRRTTRAFTLAIDTTRPFAPGAMGTLVSLATADDPRVALDIVKHPPRMAEASPRLLTRTLRVGVLGELRAQGGRAPDLVVTSSAAGGGVDWGALVRTRKS